jgi:DNA polymerase I-like protein with 3'-5' exonuclease and polymerase domains
MYYLVVGYCVIPMPHLDSDGVSYAKAAWKPAADAKEWPRARLWKGLAAENITQAAANDILRFALRKLDDEKAKVVLTVHDEIVIECEKRDAEKMSDSLLALMRSTPSWADGLPLDAEVKIMNRYGK